MKYRKKQTGLIIFFQILMCTLLLVSCILIRVFKNEAVVEAGTFGKSQVHENITFSDLAHNIEKAVIGE